MIFAILSRLAYFGTGVVVGYNHEMICNAMPDEWRKKCEDMKSQLQSYVEKFRGKKIE